MNNSKYFFIILISFTSCSTDNEDELKKSRYSYSEEEAEYGNILSIIDINKNGFKIITDSSGKIDAIYQIKDNSKNGQIIKFKENKVNQIASACIVEGEPIIHKEIHFNKDYSINKKSSFFSNFRILNKDNKQLMIDLDYVSRKTNIYNPLLLVYNYNSDFSISDNLDTSYIDIENLNDYYIEVHREDITPGDTINFSFTESQIYPNQEDSTTAKVFDRTIYFKMIIPKPKKWSYEL